MLEKIDKKKLAFVLIALAIGLFSFFFLGNKYSDPNAYSELISVLDEKKANVMGLTASTSAASIAITVLPNDIGTPLADQLANLSGYLLAILTVIYLEKYLLTVIGFAVFKIIIPIACVLFIIYQFMNDNYGFYRAGMRVAAFGIVLVLLIPTSITVSNMIDQTYQESINETLNNVNQDIVIEENTQQQEIEQPKQELKWYEKLYNVFSDAVEDVKQTVTSSTTEAVEKAKTMLTNFIEATAVMIVTSCIIPILTVLAFIWLAKIILGIDIRKPRFLPMQQNKDQIEHKTNE